MNATAFLESSVPGVPLKRGKVRDIYDFGDRLLFIATDRISAFDWILPNGIPDKGRILTGISEMWFDRLDVPNHLISMNLDDVPLPDGVDREPLEGRSMIVRKTEVVPIECVIRGYICGSGWKDYQNTGAVCGIPLPEGLQLSDRLDDLIFTPATKAESGHDENISFEQMCEAVGEPLATQLRDLSLDIYRRGAEYALSRDMIIADTKFEFGQIDGELLLIDEVLTPDSSRFWPVESYAPGGNQPSYDKQFVRDWLETTSWDKNSPPPELPEEIVAKTREKYVEAYKELVGKDFPW
ncbi:MAG: phosphoribosylaminoimidazolesuccinocarboxamide synthase [Planctomycetaceae bacterium]|jgi:phosphoribosylaminoimidazole-succinocarboxamide synthase|nr:phosphoribosylaminoimidazolesuccinocarboxamide synthase [Planctomycetaceae bacterium]MBT6484227.1 phosphoribosylaminoimidazolesuccinocarboxamide synthase [Planctomycetaceae bacterium]MBT6496736.1 phosphoribosylaminoimidazolesuccinocarboxamide synthase [Planctomycetaceae bacterium]